MGSDSDYFVFISDVKSGFRALSSDIRCRNAPISRGLILLICAAFLTQILAVVWARRSMSYVVAYLFVKHTAVAWILSPLLHASTIHLLTNVFLIWGAGLVVESRVPARRYVFFICTAAIVSTAGMYVSKAPFISEHVVAYGASGVAFAISTYAIRIDPRDWRGTLHQFSEERPVLDGVVFIVGIAVVVLVLYDVATGPYFTAEWLNGAHLSGAIVGLGFGLLTR